MLTACSSENDVLQSATQPQTTVQEQAVGFDVYTPAATSVTRAGLEGTMTTGRLQRSEYEGGGFGVYGFLVQDTEDDDASTTYADWTTNFTTPKAPNFMVNEKLLWNATNQGWYYNPLKYWPNETNNDSQNTNAEMLGDKTNYHLDRLTFFAYAPYVSNGRKPFDDVTGITYITDNKGNLNSSDGVYSTTKFFEPTIGYKAALDDPNKSVDLLWGVAPSGGLEYTAVNGKTVNVKEGMPLMDMTKPNVNTNMKFLFQHALARIGVTAVAAIDQVGAGGTLDPNTKITIEKITLTGYFGEQGFLNLNNTPRGASVANWVNANKIDLASATFETGGAKDLKKTTLTLQANHTTPDNGTIATHLQFVGDAPVATTDPASATPVEQVDRVGVTTVRQNVIQPAAIDNTPGANRNWYTTKTPKTDTELPYSETTPYYLDADCSTPATVTMPASYTVDSKGVITETTEVSDFAYPKVLKNYAKSAGWTEVTALDVTTNKYDKEKAYTLYRKKVGTLAVGDFVENGNGYTQVTSSNISEFPSKQPYTKYKAKGTAGSPAPAENDYVLVGDTWTLVTSENATSFASYVAYSEYTSYIPKDGKPREGDKVVTDGLYFLPLTAENKDEYKGVQLYDYDSTEKTYTPLAQGTVPDGTEYVAYGELQKVVPYYAKDVTYYKRDANYFMVVPTNNFVNVNPSLEINEEKLRTVRVMIEYYITTEDSKLNAGRAQTKNVIEKDVVFPSIANGKSYNLNLVLGLTSVKFEAEVDDWKVINVQGDLPQNTAE